MKEELKRKERKAMGRDIKPYTMSFIVVACVAVLCAAAEQVMAMPIVHTSDFINDGTRSHFNGFEGIPNDVVFFTGGAGPYTEDTIQVQQINGDPPNDILVVFSRPFKQGNYLWYPNGGDNGYTELSLAGGVDFQDVGFNYGTGFSSDRMILYELWDDGALIHTGAETLIYTSSNYLGFSGGGFDRIIMRDALSSGGMVTDGSQQGLAIDNIEMQGGSQPIPEPTTIALLGIGLAGLAGAEVRRRCKRKVIDKI